MAGRLDGRIALITGASRGIGAAVAKRYAAEGAQVILAARTTGGLEEVDDAIQQAARDAGREPVPATLVPIDLSNMTEIDQMAAAIAQRFGRLDVLVGNAALLGILSPMSHIDPETWEALVAVNLNANWRLIRDFEPLLKLSDAGRAMFVTSRAAANCPAYWGGYTVTKAALEAMVRTWAAELEKTSVRVNYIDPGATRTEMRATAYPGEDPMTLKTPEEITETFVALGEATCTRHNELVYAQG